MMHKMRMNYSRFVEQIADVLAAESIDAVQNEAWAVEVGIQLLNGYMLEMAERAIETQDEFLVEWCKNLMIITESEEEA